MSDVTPPINGNGNLTKLILALLTAATLGNGGFAVYNKLSHDPAPARQAIQDEQIKLLREEMRELLKQRVEDRERLVRIETLLERRNSYRRAEGGN